MRDLLRVTTYLLRLAQGLKMSRITFAGVVVAGLVSGLAMAALVAVINARLSSGEPTAALAWAFLALLVARPGLRFLSHLLTLNLIEYSFYYIRVDLCRRVLDVPMAHLEKLGRSRILASMVSDVANIAQAVIALPVLFMNLAVVVSFLAYLGWMYWPLLPVLCTLTAMGLLSLRWSVHKSTERLNIGRQHYDRIFQHLRGVTEGIRELKMHWPRREALLRDLDRVVRAQRTEIRRSDIILGGAAAWNELLFFATIGVCLFVVPALTSVDRTILVSYVVTLLMMQTPIEMLNRMVQTLAQAQASITKVQELTATLTEKSTEAPAPDPILPGNAWNQVELRGASHTYVREDSDESFTLGPVDLVLRPGEMVFLVGGNGSGKTTLGMLLLGIYVPETGEVRLDDEVIDDRSRNRYRSHFSAVFSDFFLFDSLLGIDPDNLDERARKYLSLLHLQHKVKVTDGKLSTINLSQGQRKRLALLTAYLEDRPIYLFDEWAADQDPQFKEVFYLELLPELRARGKTLIVISHDEHYYHVADRIVKMNDGRIEYDGNAKDYVHPGKSITSPRMIELPEVASQL